MLYPLSPLNLKRKISVSSSDFKEQKIVSITIFS